MNWRSIRRWGTGAVLTAAVAALAGASASLSVQPVIVDMQTVGRQASAVVTLENALAEATPLELRVRPLAIVEGELVEQEDEDTEDLLVFPGQVVLAPGGTQAFRIQWVGDPELDASRHYYVTVAQLPVALPENSGNTIQILHQFKVLVSVGTPGARAEMSVARAEIQTTDAGPRPVLHVRNTGRTYGYVGHQRMTVVQTDDRGAELYRNTFEPEDIQQRMGLGLVPSGHTRRLPINLTLPSAEGRLSIELTPVERR